jgi:hypothetical protein
MDQPHSKELHKTKAWLVLQINLKNEQEGILPRCRAVDKAEYFSVLNIEG